MIKIKNFKKGFTLIELLIVIAIIGVLATLLMANFVGVRQRARDATRKSDLRQIQAALEIYRSDNNAYPPAADGAPSDGQFSKTASCNTSLTGPTGSTSIYMKTVPCDPTGGSYTYSLDVDGNYAVTACLENTNDSQKDPSTVPGCSAASFTVKNP